MRLNEAQRFLYSVLATVGGGGFAYGNLDTFATVLRKDIGSVAEGAALWERSSEPSVPVGKLCAFVCAVAEDVLS